MPINCLINSEQIANNSCPPKKMKAALMKPFMRFLERKEEGGRRKNQQFWAFFRRFDINIFNLREHFPPPNFAYSAHNFSLPSPNLN